MEELAKRKEEFNKGIEIRVQEILMGQEEAVPLTFSRTCCCGRCNGRVIKGNELAYSLSGRKEDLTFISAYCIDKYWAKQK